MRSPSACEMRADMRCRSLSQQYRVAGDAKDVDAAQRGDIIFYREADLAPGVYTIGVDRLSTRSRSQGSARVSTLTVPAIEPRVPASAAW